MAADLHIHVLEGGTLEDARKPAAPELLTGDGR